MKNIILFSLILSVYSCDKTELEGIAKDSIKPSLREYSFDADGGSVTITTEGSRWFMNGMYINGYGETYPLHLCGIEYSEYSDIYPYKVNCDIFADERGLEPKTVEHLWFSITRENLQTLIIEFKPNDTQQKKWIQLNLNDRNYSTSITVSQSAE
ncbi:MAG: hypothetical protein LBG45_00210 [Dysgonamonadaceae bacterium]|jgi:hypothetical protein|nr:hypothetical protein [Dysgonamonadaceae bacterium]